MTHSAAVVLRRNYVLLRNDPTGLGQNNSYRITVRQLESLIRLSEALARLECSIEITVDHVNEASRLLGKSILKIHKPDYEIDEEELGVQDQPKNDEPVVEAGGKSLMVEMDD